MTPCETRVHTEAFNEKIKRQIQSDIWLAWHVAALQRTKTLPSLGRLMKPVEEHGDRKKMERDLKIVLMEIHAANTAREQPTDG